MTIPNTNPFYQFCREKELASFKKKSQMFLDPFVTFGITTKFWLK